VTASRPPSSDSESWTIGAGEGGRFGIEGPVEGSRRFSSKSVDWQPTELPGFWLKTLYEDPSRGERTMLMKVDPGASAASHTHDGEFEQIYVLEGSFYDQHATMKAGDYCCRAPNAAHTAGSEEGAIVMLVYTRRESAGELGSSSPHPGPG
jgi:quercetin dioxygenase-like cupin family protein